VLVLPAGTKFRKSAGGSLDHRIGNMSGMGGDDAQRQARKDVGVIGLGNLNVVPI
jgi:hypothetical protein